uniref:Uncharacterized protein n=1 Tax=Pseudoalteromonas rubra TaxID=43658 RepID=A0A0F4R0I8_9GAMM|nr:hypothetical protein TW77_03050 [Pseudoalteromonas rubra]
MQGLFAKHFATNHFKGGRAAHQRISGKHGIATWTHTAKLSVIRHNTFFKALNQCAFSTLSVFIQRSLTVGTKNIDGSGGAFFIGFRHESR